MTRYLVGFLCVYALGVMPLVGCSETTGDGGSGGAQAMAEAAALGVSAVPILHLSTTRRTQTA